MNLYLIDGNSYIYRAYHAIKVLSNSKGFPTNAIYGFTTMMLKVVKDRKPDALCIVFDSPVPTERHRIYEEYKAQRPETPNDLLLQIPRIKEIVRAFNIKTLELPGYEADDVICTIAQKVAAKDTTVFIVSGDKDMMQAVGKGIMIYDPMKESLIDEAYVHERFGVTPHRMAEFMALTGDATDNIPGVKGIGEKTAKDLLSQSETLDSLLKHPDMIKNERLRKMISDNVETIILSRTLATIRTDIPIEINSSELRLREPDWTSLLSLFTEFEFKSLIKLIPADGYKPRGQYKAITFAKELLDFFEKSR
jgi:DNA polymerase-1